MDDLVDWMIGTGTPDTRPVFDQAVASDIDSVADAPQPLREFLTTVRTPRGDATIVDEPRSQRAPGHHRAPNCDGWHLHGARRDRGTAIGWPGPAHDSAESAGLSDFGWCRSSNG